MKWDSNSTAWVVTNVLEGPAFTEGDNRYLQLSGGTMGGNLNMGGYTLSNVQVVGDGNGITNIPATSITEVDPHWTAASNLYYLKAQADTLFATGTPLYVFSESDPVYESEKSQYATGTPIYVETDPIWTTDKANYATAVQADARYLIATNNLDDLDDAATARTNMGLGSLALQQADAVAISGGVLDGVTLTNAALTLDGTTLEMETPDDFILLSNIGTNTLQLGGSETEVLIAGNLTVSGTQTVINSSSLNVSTNYIMVNKDGNTATALGAGLLVETDGSVHGYFRMDATDDSKLQFKAVGGSNIWLVATNKPVTLTINDNVVLPQDFTASTTYQAATNELQQQITAENSGRLAADAALSNDVASLQSEKLDSTTWSAADSTTNYLARSGGTVSGALTVEENLSTSGDASFSSNVTVNGHLTLGTNAVAPEAGTMRWNPTTTSFEGYTGSQWIPLGNVYSD